MNKLMENWKRFLNEDLLAEGRLQDAKKKYPDHAEYIDAMSAKDPSGNNKYLMWMAKQFNTDASNFSMSDEGKKIYVDTITDLVSKFHKSVQRLEKKDINQYKTLDELDDTLEKLGATSKEKRQKKKEVAQEGSRQKQKKHLATTDKILNGVSRQPKVQTISRTTHNAAKHSI
jgi:hypothetical protein